MPISSISHLLVLPYKIISYMDSILAEISTIATFVMTGCITADYRIETLDYMQFCNYQLINGISEDCTTCFLCTKQFHPVAT